jgi:DNA-binding transcriptional regulator/RsmH inhibitor MraZ
MAKEKTLIRIDGKNRMVLPGATKDALKAMPEFKYTRA